MSASNIWNEHYFVLEHPESSERASGSVASGIAEHRLAPPVPHTLEAMRADSCGLEPRLGAIQGMAGALDQANVAHTRKELELQIHHNYQQVEKSTHRLAGAKRFLAYLEGEQKSLAEVTKSDLEQWAATPAPSGKGHDNIPRARALQGAKALCAFAAQVGYIDAQRAKDIAGSKRPRFDLNELSMQLQNPRLTLQAREHLIRLGYQSAEKQHHYQSGANGLLAYLQTQTRSLADVTINDLEQWSLTPIVPNNGKKLVALPSARAFEGAKGLCALAAEVGYIDALRARGLAECQRPHFDVNSLRRLLQNPALTPKEREHHIRLAYQSLDQHPNRRAGANSFLASLELAERPFAEVSKSDLAEWALTPMASGSGKRNLPNRQAFEGAKGLCALALEVGHIDAHRAKELAECPRPHFDVDFLRTILDNPALTPQERDVQIHLNYQSLEDDSNRQAGAHAFLMYLSSQGKSLAQLTASDLKKWATTPIATGKGTNSLPNVPGFQGAKALCALAAEVGEIDAQRAQEIAECARPQGAVDALRILLQNSALTPEEREFQIRLNYQQAESNGHRQSGASGFLAYLDSQDLSLAEVSKSVLEEWALTPIGTGRSRGNLPSSLAFEGAKRLCVLAGEVGHLDAQRAEDIATCPRPRFDMEFLRTVLQNPGLTPRAREHQIRLNFQSMEKNPSLQTGANAFLVYLESHASSLAEVTKSDLEEWALTPFTTQQGKDTLPSGRNFAGAKGLCAVAAEVGYIDAQTGQDIAKCRRPHFDVDFLRTVIENPALTRRACEHEIRLNYQSTEINTNRQAGANGILAYLENRGSSLAEVTKNDLEQWALRQNVAGLAKGSFPSLRAFEGAQALCALAAEVGYIDAQRAPELAECRYPQPAQQALSKEMLSSAKRAADIAGCSLPQPGGPSTSVVLPSEAGPHVAESSSAMLERMNKRLRTDDQGASTSMFHSFAFPQSDALFRELALSPPSLLEPNEHARSPQTGNTLSLIDELESLEDMLGSAGHFS